MNPLIHALHSADCTSEIRLLDGDTAVDLQLERIWTGATCTFSVTNTSSSIRQIAEVVAFRCPMPFTAGTPVYGEGYNMLSQYTGDLRELRCLTPHSDGKHYKLPQQPDCLTVYNLLLLFPQAADVVLVGFASCRRFAGEIRFNPEYLELVLDLEGQAVGPGETLELEVIYADCGPDREALLADFGERLASHHPPLPWPEIPTGWCSWYCYGPDVTEQDIFANLAAIKERLPQLRYIQIDDGYQAHMGDWLKQHPNFPSPIRDLCRAIKDQGFEPAIWVAPFIAEADSDLFRDHPDWFIKDETGAPLPSNRDSFGGWRFGPWYMLDGTHPGACDYLRHVFRTMREEWQCTYFKLDANMWGALPFGRRFDPLATRVEAYRAGMQAVIEGAGPDSFILGCNAPMWPSIGVVHGMRITGDISRRWESFTGLAREEFNRNWQNGRLWINDPDCLVLANLPKTIVGPDGKPVITTTGITEDEFSFHAATILASGGMVLASDVMMELTDAHLATLAKLLPPSGQAAVFDDRHFRVGRIATEDGELLCLFNWSDEPGDFCQSLAQPRQFHDFWTDQPLIDGPTAELNLTLPPRSARVLR